MTLSLSILRSMTYKYIYFNGLPNYWCINWWKILILILVNLPSILPIFILVDYPTILKVRVRNSILSHRSLLNRMRKIKLLMNTRFQKTILALRKIFKLQIFLQTLKVWISSYDISEKSWEHSRLFWIQLYKLQQKLLVIFLKVVMFVV